MSNLEVIKTFLRGENAQTPLRNIYGWSCKGRTLYTEENEEKNEIHLINYDTTIAILKGNTVEVNENKYSQTTSKIQNQIKRQAERYGLKIIKMDIL